MDDKKLKLDKALENIEALYTATVEGKQKWHITKRSIVTKLDDTFVSIYCYGGSSMVYKHGDCEVYLPIEEKKYESLIAMLYRLVTNSDYAQRCYNVKLININKSIYKRGFVAGQAQIV